MNVIYGLDSLRDPLPNTAVAIGVFDGVHLGHQEILRQTVREAQSQGYQPTVLTFDVNPTSLFAPQHAPPSIVSLSQRVQLIEDFGRGIENTVVVTFDTTFAGLTPDQFVTDILEGQLSARHVLVGADFCYGRRRSGNVGTLLHSGSVNGFAVTIVPPFLVDEQRVSSTRIRQLILDGQIPAAAALLGHSFVLQGQVVMGKQVGRTLGFPTANLQPTAHDQLVPAQGVYAAYAHLPGSRTVRTALSIGTNPTVQEGAAVTVEGYLMDGFDSDLYGQTIGFEVVTMVRDQRIFSDLGALREQMHEDVARIAELIPAASVLQ